jgi:pterin-4a-carbinolamine dehydratase
MQLAHLRRTTLEGIMESLQDQELGDRLEALLPKWRLEEGKLVRTYHTGDWRRTMLLAGAIAFLAESAYHHPDVELAYTGVTVRLTSHDAGGVTARDLEMARMIEERATWRPGPDSVFSGPPDGWIE